ncbi:MAG: leucyl aminopeptidase [Myxococcaceae bacterium]|nr:leucyl aminopeptidase [Myxococcaceae bacterium]
MNFTLTSGDALELAGELLVLPVFENALAHPPQVVSRADRALEGLLTRAAGEEGFRGKADQTFILHTHGKLRAARVALLGLGARTAFEPETLRLACGRAVKAALKLKPGTVTVVLPDADEEPAALVRAAVEGFVLGAYRFDRYRTLGREAQAQKPPSRVQVHLPERVTRGATLEEAVALGQRVGEAVNWARDLVNEPAAVVTPTRLAEEAETACRKAGLKVTVGGRREIEKLKMGMFLAVARGSAEEPRLIQVSYVPKDATAAGRAPLALVGKAITFDSGGLSLKTAEGMVDMKTDMAGSAAVFAAMQVIAALKPPFPVHAFVGACENMPSGNAYRPGDVLTSRLGKTVEVTNTDAEGRLVLGDILTWASEHKPFQLVDLATLTGACIVALGHYLVGAFAVNDEAAEQVLEAGQAAGEHLWRMPITELQKDALRSEVADMKNSGERWGGAISAAIFLNEFVGDVPWVHLDIAGPSQSPRERGYYGKGATGVGVRTLVELVRQHAAHLGMEGTSVSGETPARRGRARRVRAR